MLHTMAGVVSPSRLSHDGMLHRHLGMIKANRGFAGASLRYDDNVLYFIGVFI